MKYLILILEDETWSYKVSAENLARLEGKYATLIANIAEKLDEMDINIKIFRLHIATFLQNEKNTLVNASNVIEIFEVVSGSKILNYSSCAAIEEICRRFGGGNTDLIRWINEYKIELAGFNATTKIVDYMRSKKAAESLYLNQIEEEKPIQDTMAEYDDKYCHSLCLKLKSPVAEKCLDYIDQLWASIRVHLYLPSLPVLLKSICKGCIEVTWLISTRLAQEIIVKAMCFTDVAQIFEISMVKLDHNILYVEQEVSTVTALSQVYSFIVEPIFLHL